ncbi:MAG: hypothetical protein LBT53_05740 [Puniceicoccales bacterium]|nr:hypothetical protein [Puniceicoccales bacterium]
MTLDFRLTRAGHAPSVWSAVAEGAEFISAPADTAFNAAEDTAYWNKVPDPFSLDSRFLSDTGWLRTVLMECGGRGRGVHLRTRRHRFQTGRRYCVLQ